jgi:hemerythrin superfamily protein
MDAIELIKQDHVHIEHSFQNFLETESGMTQEELFQEIETGLTAHSEMEEQVFYPALKELAPDKVAEALKEHAEVKRLLAALLDEDLNEETFESKFQKLINDVRQHVRDEESPGGILELATKSLGSQRLSRMASEMVRVHHKIEENMAARVR